MCDPGDLPFKLTPARVRLICHRHLGVGSDGILVYEGQTEGASVGLRILNPDGSEAEKSGNGVRIFARWLVDTSRMRKRSFVINTPGGAVPVEVRRDRGTTEVVANMGRPLFRPELACLDLDGEQIDITALSMGNPHCVVFGHPLEAAELRRLGPRIEQHPAFPNRTNVQVVQPLDRARVRALIWERGAGETMASGSSACAVAAACYRRGLVDDLVTVAMEGGELVIRIDEEGALWMRGPVERVCTVELSDDLLTRLRLIA